MRRLYIQISLLVLLAVSMLGCMGCRTPVEPPNGTGIDTELIPPPRPPSTNPGTGTDDRDQIGRPETPEGQGVPVPVPLSLMKTIYFDYDQSGIRTNQKKAMENNAQYLLDNPTKRILIEGHCDERGTLEYNLALGQRRSNEVARFLISRGVSADRLDTSSKGEEDPAVSGTGEAVWSKNRRVMFFFTN